MGKGVEGFLYGGLSKRVGCSTSVPACKDIDHDSVKKSSSMVNHGYQPTLVPSPVQPGPPGLLFGIKTTRDA